MMAVMQLLMLRLWLVEGQDGDRACFQIANVLDPKSAHQALEPCNAGAESIILCDQSLDISLDERSANHSR